MAAPDDNIEAIYPLTPAQQGILFHSLLAPDAPLYVQQYTCVIEGPLDPEVFQSSWQHVIERHDVLRSLLAWEARDQPLQIVRRRVQPEWRVEDWRTRTDQDEAVEQYLEEERGRGFRLDVAPLMRFGLLQLSDERTHFTWNHHHIILDGWSLGIVLEEVFTTYEAQSAGRVPDLRPPAQYRNYVRWLKSRDRGDADAYWHAKLDDFATATPLSFGSDRNGWTERHAQTTIRVDQETTADVASFARSQGVTLNTVVSGAWAIVLSRYSGEERVVFGTTLAGRPPELEGSLNMVGLFINTLPVSVTVDPRTRVDDWLKQIHQDQVDAGPYELTPLVDVQAQSAVDAGQPLFESLLVFENVPTQARNQSLLGVSDVHYLQRSNYPLAILVMPGDELEFVFLFDSDRFDATVIGRMGRQLAHVLASLPDQAFGPVAGLQVFPTDELQQICQAWNDTASPVPANTTIHALIELAGAAHPADVAVVGSGTQLSYADLLGRAEELANHLGWLGVEADDRVALLLERSPATVVGILGVLQAGGAYVPIEPTLPELRRRHLVESVNARAIITSEGVPPLDGLPVIELDIDGRIARGPMDTPRELRRNEARDEHLAYVIHTSGSTGMPKGVAVTHRSLVNSTLARLAEYGGPVDVFLLLSPYVFDSSVAGIFSTLTQSGTLVLPEQGMEQDVHHLAALIERHAVTHTLLLPSLYSLLLELVDATSLQTLQLVMVAGEPCPPDLVRSHQVRIPGARLVNEYGPTEATVWSTVADLTVPGATQADRRVPIGRPIANTQAYILDRFGRPTPVGVPGELHIGGLGLARGYLNDPELTAQAFVSRHIDSVGRVRLYRTGDVARWLDDGSIDLIGRLDHQVKLRGQRVELGEIEMALRQHPRVREAAVIHQPATDSAGARLVAYIESGSKEAEVPEEELIRFLRERLPPVMIPSRVLELAALPRGATGKVDRSALPDPVEDSAATTRTVQAPRGATEEQLMAIWSEVLGVEGFDVRDNFFTLGGDSILSIRVIARAHQAGLGISPKEFFDHPTVAGLARVARAIDRDQPRSRPR